MWKSRGKPVHMVEEPSHVKQLSLNHVCKIGLNREWMKTTVQYICDLSCVSEFLCSNWNIEKLYIRLFVAMLHHYFFKTYATYFAQKKRFVADIWEIPGSHILNIMQYLVHKKTCQLFVHKIQRLHIQNMFSLVLVFIIICITHIAVMQKHCRT